MTAAVQWRPETEHGTFADLRLDPAYRSGRALLPGGRFAVYSRGQNDCLRAAAATALGIDYCETPAPEYVGRRRRSTNWDEWKCWAAERGLVACFHEETPPIDREWWIGYEPDTGPWGEGHALVMRHATCVLDPSRLDRRERVLRLGVTFDPEYIDGRPVQEWLWERLEESLRRSREATARTETT